MWAWAGPGPRQPPGVWEGPRSPAVSPRALWASAVCAAGQAAAVSPGYISLPGIRCKGAVPAKAAESSRIGSREGECRWRLPHTHTSNADPGQAVIPCHPHPWG